VTKTFPCRGTNGKPGAATISVSKRGATTIRWKPTTTRKKK